MDNGTHWASLIYNLIGFLSSSIFFGLFFISERKKEIAHNEKSFVHDKKFPLSIVLILLYIFSLHRYSFGFGFMAFAFVFYALPFYLPYFLYFDFKKFFSKRISISLVGIVYFTLIGSFLGFNSKLTESNPELNISGKKIRLFVDYDKLNDRNWYSSIFTTSFLSGNEGCACMYFTQREDDPDAILLNNKYSGYSIKDFDKIYKRDKDSVDYFITFTKEDETLRTTIYDQKLNVVNLVEKKISMHDSYDRDTSIWYHSLRIFTVESPFVRIIKLFDNPPAMHAYVNKLSEKQE